MISHGTADLNANSPPSSIGNSIQSLGYDAPAESQIWSLDCNTLALTAQWTNTVSTNPTTNLFYGPPVNFLALVGHLTAFTNNYDDGAYLVTATFVLS
ncbi:hypothetical protein K438DRAFT_1970767 [Mycena galopus ATCC 62051]|nr:hypothetical protein K438DRAFT_1970767 [Mycena galopus ATCC 62051]